MFKKLFKNKITGYIINFLISGAIDLSIYTLLYNILLNIVTVPLNLSLVIATAIARISSSLFNFKLNKRLFAAGSKNSKIYLFKYYVLWFLVLTSSFRVVIFTYENIIANAVIAKILTDIVIGICSYLIQRLWVFNKIHKGLFFYLVIFICRIFTKVKFKKDKKTFKEASVLIGHHQNFYSPLVAFMYLPKTTHIWVISHLFTFKDCYDKYHNYTFKNNKKIPRFLSSIISAILGIFIPIFLHSAKAIPVYRNSKKIIYTFKMSVDLLEKNHQIIIFPDIEYNSKDDQMNNIYSGFLKLDTYYFKKTNKRLPFIPVVFDKKNKEVYLNNKIKLDDFNMDNEVFIKELTKNINKI